MDVDFDIDIDDIFDAFDEDDHAASRLPPVPLPAPVKRKRPAPAAAAPASAAAPPTAAAVHDVDDDDEEMDDVVTAAVKRARLENPEEETPEVLDEFMTEHEKVLGIVGGTGALEGPSVTAAGGQRTKLIAGVPVLDGPSSDAVPSAGDAPEDVNSGEVKFTKANVATRHEVVLPAGFDKAAYVPMRSYVPPPQAEWCRQYPFTLDPFQEYSIYCIQRNESVLVAAHTSAGKTVVAEYAIAQALKNKQRVVYTSPIKALSNQKYRELLEDFGDVGLMTGDVTINPRASCLVMTTEILRSMIYRGSEVLREISWVVYDEIHYMRDAARGVVWEETLILLPPTVHFVFLSATIPNAKQFAQWISKIHSQPCHVVYTDYRPTPLQHYVFPANSAGIHLVVDEKGTFREDNFQKAMATLASAEDNDARAAMGGKGGRGGPAGGAAGSKKAAGQKEKSDIYKIVKMIMQKNYHPVIVFSFAKKECESLALNMSKLDFNDDTEKQLVDRVFENAISQLNEDDRALPQISNILPLLRRGVGIHHSGLLPILKETIEILFQEGLLKVLFATETFSIGLNMPAKTVVFTKIEKFDGKETRHLTGGEYIQMSGRAGRRGLDDKGIVIMMVDQKIDTEKAKGMVKGVSDALHSAFKLGYNMILNLTRVEGVSPEYLIRNSFRQFQNNAKLPKLLTQAAELEDAYADMEIANEDSIRSYYEARYTLDQYTKDFREVVSHPSYATPFIRPGRLVQIVANGLDFGWGVVINMTKRKSVKLAEAENRAVAESANNYILDVALLVEPAAPGTMRAAADASHIKVELLRPLALPLPGSADTVAVQQQQQQQQQIDAFTKAELVVVPVSLATVASLSSVVIKVDAERSLRDVDARKALHRTVVEVRKRLNARSGGVVPVLDPIRDMNITDKKFGELMGKIAKYRALVEAHPLTREPARLAELYEQYSAKITVSEQIKAVRKTIREAEAIQQLDELKARKRILRRLGFTDDRDVIQVKGRVACEVSSGDTLLLTELLFNGVFNDLTVEQAVALLGVFTFVERTNPKDAAAAKAKLREELDRPMQVLLETHKRMIHVYKEAKLEINETELLDMYKPDLMEVVYAWANGAKFAHICKMTDVFEGSLVRNFRMLEELLKQMANAAKAIGNQDLEIKFTEGIAKIKRDIIFANSLYL
ncbi:ATP-dependent RNA helicase mtr4 [Blastocladiella emersonii ATCC 22665]|nr:ATP-dependent RNA helicase mtr4 [Blastocladiella emersonii ATCC 22665]